VPTVWSPSPSCTASLPSRQDRGSFSAGARLQLRCWQTRLSTPGHFPPSRLLDTCFPDRPIKQPAELPAITRPGRLQVPFRNAAQRLHRPLSSEPLPGRPPEFCLLPLASHVVRAT
jgi:hypothetical protein